MLARGFTLRAVDETTLRWIESGDAAAAVMRIESKGAPDEVAWRYDEAVREVYWKAKDLPAAVTIGRAGIQYCLGRVNESSAPAQRDFFGTRAKALAFNVASFSWPGWAEPGIAPTAEDLAAGMQAARLNLRLAEELSKPTDRVEDAHWLVGAHLLAVGDAAAALEQFRQASPETRPLYAGYVLLAEVVLGRSGADGKFEDLVGGMRASRHEEMQSYASQLETARGVFL